jgi:ADP-heptose:LPS heptosyltransferase
LLCGHDQAAELLVDCGLADRWISAQATVCTALFAGVMPDDLLLKDWLKRCEVAVAWTRDDAGTLAAALKSCGAASIVVQSPFASTLKSAHQSERFVETLGGAPDPASTPSISLPHAIRAEAAAHLAGCGVSHERPLALVHPGSGSRHKCVKPEVLLPVLEGLEALGLEPLLLEGPADHDVVDHLLRDCSRRPVVLRGLSVRVLAGILSQVDLFIGHDSGVTHLAALAATPTVALFGPTDPARWAPRGPTVSVIHEKPCRCASWDAVRSCVDKPCLQLSPHTILGSAGRREPSP